jgi:PncC family amidohydrolase
MPALHYTLFYTFFNMKVESKIVRHLKKKRSTVSIAESCTGGLVAQRLTSISGASSVFGYGVISYSADCKKKILKVPASTLKKYGEVSQDVAIAMAQGVLKISNSNFAIAVTGIAGPTGGTRKKPVGTVCFALISKRKKLIKKYGFSGDRARIRRQASTKVLNLLYRCLKDDIL